MIFIDTNIFMYAAGRAHAFKAPCVSFLESIAKAHSAHTYCTNTEVLQEILHRYRSINALELGLQLFDLVLNLGLVIHPVELPDLTIARNLHESHPTLSTRDTIHLAIAIRRNFEIIVSYDRGFSDYKQIERKEPK